MDRSGKPGLLGKLIEAGCSRIAYVAIDSCYRDSLKRALLSLGVEWDDSMWVSNVADIDEKLPGIFRAAGPDTEQFLFRRIRTKEVEPGKNNQGEEVARP